jgi:hypothetical protein
LILRLVDARSKQRTVTGEEIAQWSPVQSGVIEIINRIVNIHALVVVRWAAAIWTDMGTMNVGPNLRENQVDCSACDVVALKYGWWSASVQ